MGGKGSGRLKQKKYMTNLGELSLEIIGKLLQSNVAKLDLEGLDINMDLFDDIEIQNRKGKLIIIGKKVLYREG